VKTEQAKMQPELLFATHPRPAIGEWLYGRTVSDHSHRSESLFTALAHVPWQQAAEQ
jgi:hypothetical protein